MKRKIAIILMLLMSLSLAGCKSATTDTVTERSPEELEVVISNDKNVIAEILEEDEDSDIVQAIGKTLNTLNAGQITSASAGVDDNGNYVDVSAENGDVYRIYRSSDSVESVKNLITDEWVIEPEK